MMTASRVMYICHLTLLSSSKLAARYSDLDRIQLSGLRAMPTASKYKLAIVPQGSIDITPRGLPCFLSPRHAFPRRLFGALHPKSLALPPPGLSVTPHTFSLYSLSSSFSISHKRASPIVHHSMYRPVQSDYGFLSFYASTTGI